LERWAGRFLDGNKDAVTQPSVILAGFMDAYTRNWHRELLGQLNDAAENRGDSLPITPSLEEQIAHLTKSLPPVLVNRPWLISELTDRLVGKYRNHPHPENVAQALKKLGWVQTRDWTVNGCGRRFGIHLARHNPLETLAVLNHPGCS